MSRLISLMFPPLDRPPQAGVRSVCEPFAVPHTFNPSLTFCGALIALMSWIARIFLGNLLFAVWGVGSLMAWSRIHNCFWRALALPPLVLLFLVSFAALMIAISTVVRWISPHRS
jgi:hypothetical protein